MLPRSLKTEISYWRYRRTHPSGCGYCKAYAENDQQVIAIKGTMMVLTARFPYAKWDGWKVGEHLLVIPIRHTGSFSRLTDEESRDMMDIIKSYEANHYSFYIRSYTNKRRSMLHVHGHLIKARSAL